MGGWEGTWRPSTYTFLIAPFLFLVCAKMNAKNETGALYEKRVNDWPPYVDLEDRESVNGNLPEAVSGFEILYNGIRCGICGHVQSKSDSMRKNLSTHSVRAAEMDAAVRTNVSYQRSFSHPPGLRLMVIASFFQHVISVEKRWPFLDITAISSPDPIRRRQPSRSTSTTLRGGSELPLPLGFRPLLSPPHPPKHRVRK